MIIGWDDIALAIFPVEVTTVTFFSKMGLAIPGCSVTTLGVTVLIIVGAPDPPPVAIGRCVMMTVRGGPPCAGTSCAC